VVGAGALLVVATEVVGAGWLVVAGEVAAAADDLAVVASVAYDSALEVAADVTGAASVL
jgi:hypothetical protein